MLKIFYFFCCFTVFYDYAPKLLCRQIEMIIKAKCNHTTSSLIDTSHDMVEMTAPAQSIDGQTQFGNTRHLESSDCIFVFKNTFSDYEEPPSDEEVSTTFNRRNRSS